MIGILGITLLGMAFIMALVASSQLLARNRQNLARRLHAASTTSELALGMAELEEESQDRPLARLLRLLGRFAPGASRAQALRDRLAGAGIYDAEASKLFLGAKIMTAGVLAVTGYGVTSILIRPHAEQLAAGLLMGGLGYLLPGFWLRIRTLRRQQAIRLALPDALDLLVVCVEAGLGLNAAIVRVGHELKWSCPPLSQELSLVNQEIRAGNSRTLALRNFAKRVPIPDVQALVAMFVQADRLGTSIGRSLRVHSDMLRTKRRQRAEESARKATVKLIFPLVFFVFPELLVVILGPAGLRLFTELQRMAGQ